MLAGCGKAGDYAGNPLLTVATQSIFWTNLGQTKRRVQVCVTLEPGLLKRIDAENAKTGAPRGKILERMLCK